MRMKEIRARQRKARQMRRKAALVVMVGILAAGVENCLLLPSGNNYTVGADLLWGAEEGKVELETEISSEGEAGQEMRYESEMGEEPDCAPDIAMEQETESVSEADTWADTNCESETGEWMEYETEFQTESEIMAKDQIQDEMYSDQESMTEESETAEKSETSEEENPEESEMSEETKAPEELETSKQTEDMAETVERGVHYEITGDPESWYRSENGLFWVKAGSAIYVQPLSGGGYNMGSSLENLTSDGNISFTLKKIKKNGTVAKESAAQSENYYVDGEAPLARFQISGSQQSETLYASGTCSVVITVEPDGKSGLNTVSYKILPCDVNGSVTETAEDSTWTVCDPIASVLISEEGLFRVYVKTTDMVGNVAYSRSSVICVDRTAPMITIAGVSDQTAYSGNVSLKVSCSDTWYKPGTMQVSIAGVNQGNVPSVKESGENDTGAWVEYFDFPEIQSYDDIYTVTVTAEDRTGNIGSKTIQFSINRYGSAYDLSVETKSILEQYFLSEPCDVVFYETNIDYVGESTIYCRHDGVLRMLTEDVDYVVSMEGGPTTWKQYCYSVSAECFSQEGVYELLLVSQDAAENQSDTGIQQKRVTFVLDWSAPSCTVSGITSGEIYDVEAVTVHVTPSDNFGLRSLKIYNNSELFLEDSNQPVSGETIQITLDDRQEWQTLQIWICDMAGNEYWTEEIPVFISTEDESVPAYEKVRKSAKELTEEATIQNITFDELKEIESQEDSSAEVNQTAEENNGEKNDTRADLGQQFIVGNWTTADEGDILSKKEGAIVGWIMLGGSIIIFTLTILSIYPVFGKRFK